MFAQVDHPGLGLLMDPTNYFEAHNIDRMDQVLNQVFDTLADKIRIAHAKDVKRSGSDKTEKHADIGDADAHEGLTFRGVGEIELPAPGLRPLSEAAQREAPEHSRHHRASDRGRRAAGENISRREVPRQRALR
ncbi:hypothetical protein X746_24620 [Mesorhizobium sp. LNJC380A00]|nr:hypothetical protein X746_24620 [Mesorhizobium sp. LNJC380A00]